MPCLQTVAATFCQVFYTHGEEKFGSSSSKNGCLCMLSWIRLSVFSSEFSGELVLLSKPTPRNNTEEMTKGLIIPEYYAACVYSVYHFRGIYI